MCAAPQPDRFILRLISFSPFPPHPSPPPPPAPSSLTKSGSLRVFLGLAPVVGRRQVLRHQKVPVCPSGQIKTTTK